MSKATPAVMGLMHATQHQEEQKALKHAEIIFDLVKQGVPVAQLKNCKTALTTLIESKVKSYKSGPGFLSTIHASFYKESLLLSKTLPEEIKSAKTVSELFSMLVIDGGNTSLQKTMFKALVSQLGVHALQTDLSAPAEKMDLICETLAKKFNVLALQPNQ